MKIDKELKDQIPYMNELCLETMNRTIVKINRKIELICELLEE